MMVRLFGVDISNSNVKLEETKRTKKRKSTRLFGQEIVPQRRKSATMKTRSSKPPSPQSTLPFLLMETIREMEGKDLIFVVRNILKRSDTDIGQNRFLVLNNEVLWGLLSEAEKAAVEGGDGLGVVVVDPGGGEYDMELKKWMSWNMIVLNSTGWRKFVKNNGVKKEDDSVELWSFRGDSKLCFGMNVKRDGSPSN